MTTTLTDAQIDARATVYALNHRVSYTEALGHVVAFAEAQTSAVPSAASATNPLPLTDAEADVQAQRYAAQNGVDYLTALHIVLHHLRGVAKEANNSSTQSSHASTQDQRIDAAATAHARAKGVSYSEALDYVTIHQDAASFSEGVGLADDAAAVNALQNQPIEIFRAGTHVDNAGKSHIFSVADVKAMAAVYNPARHEAPLTLGHPDVDHPAYGWVKGLTATEDGQLLMQAVNVDPEFAKGVKTTRYKKRSASFYPPFAPGNPVPGQWYLRHVGWLGAHPPAIKGLADVNFANTADDTSVCFDWA